MGAFFRTDPSITARGIAPAFDPIAAMSRIANLRRLQQRGQFNQQQLERMERQRARRQAVRGAIGEGGTRADMLRRLQEVAPVAGLEYAEKFRQEDRAAAVEQRAAENQRLAKIQSDLDFIAQRAGPLKALEEGGVGRAPADLETMQVAYADVLKWLEDHDVDTSWMPKEYTPGLADQAIREGLTAKQQVTAAQQAAELAERKAAREKKVPGVHIPFPPKVEAQKRRLGPAGRPTARDIRNREAAMIEATATDYLTEANGDPDEALALLEEEVRLPNASAEFRRLASKIRNRIRERVRPGRSRRSTEGDRLEEILGPLEQ